MDFKNAKELLALCQEKNLPISEVMRQREIILGETTARIVDQRMDRVLEIMKDAAFSPIKDPVISMGGLIGGEAKQITGYRESANFMTWEKACAEMFSERVSPTLWQPLRPTLPWDLSLPLLLPAVPGSFPE